MVLIVVAHIVCQGVQGSIVAVCLLTLQRIATVSQQATLSSSHSTTTWTVDHIRLAVCIRPVSADLSPLQRNAKAAEVSAQILCEVPVSDS